MRSRIRFTVLVAAWLGVVFSSPLVAQAGSLVGTVIDEYTLRPLQGARVSVDRSSIRVRTDSEGNFRIPELPAGAVTIRVEADGYSGMVEAVEVTPAEVAYAQFLMLGMSAVLETLRIRARGSDGPSQGGRVAEVSPRSDEGSLTAADLLARQVPGLTVFQSASAGGSGRIQIRGTRSISLSSEPVIFLNGVRISSAAGASQNQAYQTLKMIPAREVRRIRVLRGASAESIYGDSANGVILIETLSGEER